MTLRLRILDGKERPLGSKAGALPVRAGTRLIAELANDTPDETTVVVVATNLVQFLCLTPKEPEGLLRVAAGVTVKAVLNTIGLGSATFDRIGVLCGTREEVLAALEDPLIARSLLSEAVRIKVTRATGDSGTAARRGGGRGAGWTGRGIGPPPPGGASRGARALPPPAPPPPSPTGRPPSSPPRMANGGGHRSVPRNGGDHRSVPRNGGGRPPMRNGGGEPAMANGGGDHTSGAEPPETAPPTAAEPPEAAPASSTRTVFGSIEADDVVEADELFEVVAGLAPEPVAGVAGVPMEVPSEKDFQLDIQLLAFGFEIKAPESWRRVLEVTSADPFPKTAYHLKAKPGTSGVRSLEVKYSMKGDVIGIATRMLKVVPAGAPRAGEVPPPAQPPLELPGDDALTADVTVTILQPFGAAKGEFLATIDSVGSSVDPDVPHEISLGRSAREFARNLIRKVNSLDGDRRLQPALASLSRRIAEELPEEFGQALKEADEFARSKKRRPTVLFLTAEPYIPWELAAVDPVLDSEAPPFLAAQATVGRWPIARKPPPPARPVERGTVRKAAFVSGVYQNKVAPRLEFAEQEVVKLAKTFGSKPVQGNLDEVLDLLQKGKDLGLVHFALHGQYDQTDQQDGLITLDGKVLDPATAEGISLPSGPLIFLNACQVGTGNELLGDYAGMATAFLRAGAAAVIAPLWSVDDREASKLALSFYKKTLTASRKEAPAEVLRKVRVNFLKDPLRSTCLAYQFYGHPAFRMDYVKQGG